MFRGDFTQRTVATTLVFGAVLSIFAIQYLGPGVGLTFAIGVALGALHLQSWRGLAGEILFARGEADEPDKVRIAVWVAAKLGLVYVGSLVYLYHYPRYALPFIIGFTMVFVVMLQKALGQRIIAAQKGGAA